MKPAQLLNCKMALENAGFEIPDGDLEVLNAMVSKDQEWVDQFEEYYPNPTDGILDTVEREELWEMVAKELTNGMHWPLYMDGEEYSKKFLNALNEGANRIGWRYLPAEGLV